jgi:protein TonB
MKHPYTKPAGISLLVHVALLCLALFVTGQAISTPIAPEPPPIEIEIEPSKLIDMGAGKLHFTSGSPVSAPRPAPKLKIRMAAAKPVPKPTPSEPPPASAPTTLDPPPPGETSENSVGVPRQGDKVNAGGGTGVGTGGASGGGRGTGGTGAGTGSSTGDGEGGGGAYTGAGFRSGSLPGYPGGARRAGREGIVTVRVLVGTDGTPISVTVRVTSGHEDFDDAAVQAVKKWRFSPARRGKDPVASFHDVRIRFRLDEAR